MPTTNPATGADSIAPAGRALLHIIEPAIEHLDFSKVQCGLRSDKIHQIVIPAGNAGIQMPRMAGLEASMQPGYRQSLPV